MANQMKKAAGIMSGKRDGPAGANNPSLSAGIVSLCMFFFQKIYIIIENH
jgi:hypothetical protein